MAEHNSLFPALQAKPAAFQLCSEATSAPVGLFDLLAASPRGGEQESLRRLRLWQLDGELHCSIIGTCLSLAELRTFARKINLRLDERPTDHAFHSAVVYAVGCDEKVAKLLHKVLDRKFDAALRRYSRAQASGSVAELWREDLARGEIPGAYWAVMTHPSSDQGLVSEAFSEIHMLSHLVGASNRAEIRQIHALERENASLHDRIAQQRRQSAEKMADLAQENEELRLRMAAVARPEPSLRDAEATAALAARIDEIMHDLALEAQRRERAEQIAADQAAALDRIKKDLDASVREVEEFRALCENLERRLEGQFNESDILAGAGERANRLKSRRLLFVGGKPHKIPHMRRLVATEGAEFLSHDGGVEESADSLAHRIAAADVVLFPVDCVSHEAALRVKRLCRHLDKPFLPLRTFSLATVSRVLDELSEGCVDEGRRLKSA